MDNAQTREELLNIARDCLAVRVRMINRVVTAAYEEELRPLGLKVSQMNILVAVALFGPARPSDVCRALHLDPSTLSRNVERMKRKGWIETITGRDGRSHVLKVTGEGFNITEAARPAWEHGQARAAALLGEDGVAAIRRVGNELLRITE